MYILGFSVGHDKGAVLIKDCEILVGISEERITRIKHDGPYNGNLPKKSIDYCLEYCNLSYDDIDLYVYTTTEKDFNIEKKFSEQICSKTEKLKFIPHHLSHAFSAFYSSGFSDSVVVVADAMGSVYSKESPVAEWYDICDLGYDIAEGYAIYDFTLNDFKEVYKRWVKYPLPEKENPYEKISIGFSYGVGSKQLIYDENTNSWPAGKLMGLASYANKDYLSLNDVIFKKYENDLDFSLKIINPEIDYMSDFSSKANAAGLYQKFQEEVSLELVKLSKKLTKSNNICVAGGSFLNCNTNELILKSKIFQNCYFIPASDDSGAPLGCAWYGVYFLNKLKKPPTKLSPYLGKSYNDKEIFESLLEKIEKIKFSRFYDENELLDVVSQNLKENKVIGWFQNGSEIGPRALGNRSILASPVQSWMIHYINSEIKKREWYRPFAPSVLFEKQNEIFEIDEFSPYMLVTTKVKDNWKGRIPSVVHIDGTSRIQSVTIDSNSRYYKLIKSFYEKTNVPLLLNTSFNGPKEPIVETPLDALNTFLETGLYALILNDFYITRI